MKKFLREEFVLARKVKVLHGCVNNEDKLSERAGFYKFSLGE
jgi:hypothetical protein